MVIVDTGALYSCLVSDLHDDESCDPPTVKAKALLQASILKKFKGSTSADADALAVEKFLRFNNNCRDWGRRRSQLWDDELFGHFKEEVHKFFVPSNRYPLFSTSEEILDLARVGPGASIGSRGTDFYTKLFSSDLTCTSTFLEVSYRNYLSNCPSWADAEMLRSQAGYGFKVVPGSRTSCVPKTADISRTICVEPGLNMYFQLGLGAIIEKRLESYFGINLSSQPDVNRELARVGSLDDNLCTIDLEGASDSVSLRMVKEVMPRDIFSWFNLLRSPSTELPNGERVQLDMLSSMGNGFTFPLQTALFCCAIAACNSFLRLPRRRAGVTWSVFGDDIIVERTIVQPLISLLSYLGFTVNADKSFFEGPFRESCGSDYYRGRNVRGVYLKELSTQQDLCVALNLLNRWTARHGVLLRRTVQLLKRHTRFIPVPPYDSDDAGVMVPKMLLERWGWSKRYQSILYRRYAAQPSQLVVADGIIKSPRGSRKRIYNPEGLLRSLLQGSLVKGRISVRHNATLYRLRTGVAPSWDAIPKTPSFEGVTLQQWQTAVWRNFS